jgi:glutathione S-transferase
MPTLVIANKLYSSWSLRPWILMKQLGMTFDEIVIPLDLPTTRAEVLKHSPAGKVPILIDGDVTVWETLAIMEYLGDAHRAPVWPSDVKARAMARSVSAEMHSGFSALRSACPMNLGKRYANRDRGEAVGRDVARFEEVVAQARGRFGHGGAFLFGAFSAADAMFAPLVTRLDTYSFSVSERTRSYMDAVLSLPAFREWRAAALQETWIVPSDEVDEEPIANYRKAA